jgi:hypothetical protein
MEPVIIKLSKSKIALLTIGSALFVLAGIWMLLNADEQTRRSPIVLKIVGVAAILFFGICFIYSIIKLFDNKPGLIVDDKGITDNSSGVAAGFIPWKKIKSIKVIEIKSTRFLLIYTSNPESYLNDKNTFKKKMMQLNNKMYGTPVNISSNSLKFKFDDLEQLLQSCLERYKAEV